MSALNPWRVPGTRLATRILPGVAVIGVLIASLAGSHGFNGLLVSGCGYGYGYGGGLPTVTNVSPAMGPVTGGTTVTVTGTGFCNSTSAVHFGTSAGTGVSVVSDTSLTVVSPAHAAGAVDVTVTTAAGTSTTSPADQFTYVLFTQYFNWYDRATPGMVADNIHLLNTSGSTAHITVTLSGATPINVTLAAGAESYVSFGAGHIGGPVVVNSDQQILASQRVQYFQSFNEVWAMSASQAAMKLYIPWFDKATNGMVGDNIHVLNPGSSAATVTVTLSGATPIVFSLPAGAENYVTFPVGKIGGPVIINATQPVLAAQRVQYFKSFNEEVARPATAAILDGGFNWFDRATPGMVGDNIHVLNPGVTSANVSVSLPGATTISFVLAAGAENYVSFGSGHIGGPVRVLATQPVLASQRVQYFQSFNEVPEFGPSNAQTTSHIMWFDKATFGMVGDNIHILNTGVATAHVTITLPGASSLVFTVGVGVETYVSFPSGHLGGPVTITSDQPVEAAQRVQYFQSFNEVGAM